MLPSSLGTVLKDIMTPVFKTAPNQQISTCAKHSCQLSPAIHVKGTHSVSLSIYSFIYTVQFRELMPCCPYYNEEYQPRYLQVNAPTMLHSVRSERITYFNHLVYNSYNSFIPFQRSIHDDVDLFLDSENEWPSIMRCFNWREKCQKNRIIFVSISMRQWIFQYAIPANLEEESHDWLTCAAGHHVRNIEGIRPCVNSES